MSSSGSSDVGCSRKHPFLPGRTPGSSEVPWTWGPLPCLAISTKEITNDELKAAKWDQIRWKCIRFDEGVYTSKSTLFLTCLKTEPLSTFERYRIARSSKNDATWSPMEYGRNCGAAEIPQTPKNPWRPFFVNVFLLSPVLFQNQHDRMWAQMMHMVSSFVLAGAMESHGRWPVEELRKVLPGETGIAALSVMNCFGS